MRATGSYEKTRAEFTARQPMDRLGRSEELAALAVPLALDESGATTGAVYVADGGATL
jgi:2-keto-3-deoxy-L-fuconate dehydrogenase